MSLILAVSVVILAQLGLFLWGSRRLLSYFDRKQEDMELRVRNELAALVKGEPCQSASVLLAIGQTVGREAGRSAKQAIFQEAGVAQRLANQVTDDQMVEGISAKQPAIGQVLAGLSRGQRKGLLGNPLVQLALQGLAGGGSTGGAPVPSGNNEHKTFSL